MANAMKPRYPWTEAQVNELRRLVEEGGKTYREIAAAMGLDKDLVKNKARCLGLRNSTQRERFIEVKTRSLEVVLYGVEFGIERACQRYCIDKKEYYMRRAYVHERLDWESLRTLEHWTLDEYIWLLGNYGIKNRRWLVANNPKGRKDAAIKCFVQRHGLSSTWFHGLGLEDASLICGDASRSMVTIDVSTSGGWKKIVPWFVIYKHNRAQANKNQSVHAMLRALARFQTIIYGIDGLNEEISVAVRIMQDGKKAT